jgi:hypothetical protein
VCFIVQSDTPITTQRLKRVSFEGIPQSDPTAKAKIGVTVRQNLPVLTSYFELPAGTTFGADAKVRIYPLTTYGYATQPFDAPLKKQ